MPWPIDDYSSDTPARGWKQCPCCDGDFYQDEISPECYFCGETFCSDRCVDEHQADCLERDYGDDDDE